MKILLVDDEREEREGISWLIKKYKYPLEIVQAANGKEALQCIEKYKIDILFTDVKMPVMNGLELAKEVYKRWPEIKIIIYSAYGEFDYAKQALEANAVSYLLKPIEIEEFQKLMVSVIQAINDDNKNRITNYFSLASSIVGAYQLGVKNNFSFGSIFAGGFSGALMGKILSSSAMDLYLMNNND